MNRITKLTLSGFKSIVDPITVEFKGLTILAGANSSGKSSVMQPLLLMKQTLEAQYDPGVFLLDGPNVLFENYTDFFSKTSHKDMYQDFIFQISICVDGRDYANTNEIIVYEKYTNEFTFKLGGNGIHLGRIVKIAKENKIDMDFDKLQYIAYRYADNQLLLNAKISSYYLDRLFVKYVLFDGTNIGIGSRNIDFRDENDIQIESTVSIIHIPGLREGPKRTYKNISVSNLNNKFRRLFEGTFDNYVASVIKLFEDYKTNDIRSYNRNTNEYFFAIDELYSQLSILSLTGDLVVVKRSDSQISLKVSRYPTKPAESDADRVDISDVGYGVSQVLPVLVGLLVAQPGQMVYIEQPELHLHPNAQYLLAKPIVDAVNRGVNVVFETHSSILLLGIQTAVAKGELDKDKVSLNWFERDAETGLTKHTAGTLDENGAYVDWPVDFDDVYLDAQLKYMESGNLGEVFQ